MRLFDNKKKEYYNHILYINIGQKILSFVYDGNIKSQLLHKIILIQVEQLSYIGTCCKIKKTTQPAGNVKIEKIFESNKDFSKLLSTIAKDLKIASYCRSYSDYLENKIQETDTSISRIQDKIESLSKDEYMNQYSKLSKKYLSYIKKKYIYETRMDMIDIKEDSYLGHESLIFNYLQKYISNQHLLKEIPKNTIL